MSKFSTHDHTFISVGDAGKVFTSCHHCGLGIRYYASFKNNSTDEVIHIGQTCFANATPNQKRAFNLLKAQARIANKVEKFLTTDSLGIRLASYCKTNPKSEDADNQMLHLKLQHLSATGFFNNAELILINKLLTQGKIK